MSIELPASRWQRVLLSILLIFMYMLESRKLNYDGLFFVTINVVAWVDVFGRKDYIDIVIKKSSILPGFGQDV
jgi:hypothetical protein